MRPFPSVFSVFSILLRMTVSSSYAKVSHFAFPTTLPLCSPRESEWFESWLRFCGMTCFMNGDGILRLTDPYQFCQKCDFVSNGRVWARLVSTRLIVVTECGLLVSAASVCSGAFGGAEVCVRAGNRVWRAFFPGQVVAGCEGRWVGCGTLRVSLGQGMSTGSHG